MEANEGFCSRYIVKEADAKQKSREMRFASGSSSFSFCAFMTQSTLLIKLSLASILGKEVVKERLALRYIPILGV